MRASMLVSLAFLAGCSTSSTQPWLTDTGLDTGGDPSGDTLLDTGHPDGTDAVDVTPDCWDADSDGVCDADDVCPGFDDREDGDSDTVPDGCDICPGGDDRIDTDGDMIPDFCDCEGLDCDENATCFNMPGGPECVCDEGYEGDGFVCTDVDECAIGTDTCDAHAACTNVPGSYTCACSSGYTGDGYVCTDINECASGTDTCSPYATCTNTDGSYTCTCTTGYTGDGFTCTPIDHCAAGTDTCSSFATCTFTGPGTYTCACNPGYTGDGFSCTPINHCSAGTDLCSPYATCTYTGPGTYTCTCLPGYTGDGFTCTPISTSVTFSQWFTASTTSPSQCTAWETFRASLTGTYTTVTIKGNYDETGVSCTGSTANLICQALRTASAGTWSCGGRTWMVGECGVSAGSWELSAEGSICSCPSPGYIARPCIGNQNWGGAATATCWDPPSQRLDVVCN